MSSFQDAVSVLDCGHDSRNVRALLCGCRAGRLTSPCAAPTQRDLGQAARAQSEEGALSGAEIARATAAFEVTIQDQRLPAQDLGKEFGRGRWLGCLRFGPVRGAGFGSRLSACIVMGISRGVAIAIGSSLRPRSRCAARVLGSILPFRILVASQFLFDVSIGRGTAAATAMSRTRLIANAIAYSFGLLDDVIEEVADIVGHPVDHREHLFEDVSHEIRSRNAEILGESPNVIGELLRDPCMKNPLLASALR